MHSHYNLVTVIIHTVTFNNVSAPVYAHLRLFMYLTGDPSLSFCWFEKDVYPVEKPGLFSSDVGISAMYIYFYPEILDKIDLSEMMWADENCLLARLPPPIKRQDTLIMPFSSTIWILLFAACFGALVFLFGYSYQYKQKAELSDSLWLLIICASLFQEHDGNVNKLKSDGLRLFFSIFFSMTFILTSSYAGVLVSFLSIPPKLPLMRTMKDVAESPLPLVQYSFMKEPFDPNVYRQKILDKTFEHDRPPTLLSKVLNGELILIGSRLLLNDMIKKDTSRYCA